MMEAPDSPPETFNNSFDGNSNSQAAGGNRASSESSKVNHGAPGSSWNTKKFREEYDRVYNGLLDQNWDHSKSLRFSRLIGV